MRKTIALFWMLFVAVGVWAAEVGLVTAVSGGVKLQEEKGTPAELKAFVKIRDGDRLMLDGGAKLQVVYFDGGRQEIWQGPGALEVGSGSSKVVKGTLQPEVKSLPAILVKQLSKTPSPEGNVKTGMIRMRGMSPAVSLDAVEKVYADLKAQAAPGDRGPELYLLAAYFEMKEYDKLDATLRDMREKAPGDPEIKSLTTLYSRAVSKAKAGAAQN